MVQSAETIFRDFTTDGIPASGTHEPRKVEIREWGAYVETGILGGAAGSAVFASKSSMVSNLGYPQFTMVWVIGDATAANNGIYRKIGTSGSGSWARTGDLPYGFIRASNVGAGTANAIVATTSMPMPGADGAALIALPIFTDSTAAPVTVAFNGAAPLTIKTNTGGDVQPGGLVAGMIVVRYKSATTFRLLSDQVAASLLAAMEALYEQFNTLFLGAQAVAPTVDGNGDPLVSGAVYYSTSNGLLYVYDGSAWQSIATSIPDGSITDAKIATPSLLRNRNLDQVFLTDFMSASLQRTTEAAVTLTSRKRSLMLRRLCPRTERSGSIERRVRLLEPCQKSRARTGFVTVRMG